MSTGGFYLSQFKITYNTTDYSTLYDYGADLLSKYANCILTASQQSDGNWSVDADMVSGADDTVNSVPIYNFQTRIPVWGDAYPTGSYNIGCFLKYDNGTTVRHLFLMLNSCVYYFDASVSSGSVDKNSLNFRRVLLTTSNDPFMNTTTGYPLSMGAMCRVEPFDITDLCNNSKNVLSVSDTPLFPINGCFINSFKWTDFDVNIPFNYEKLSTPNENASYVLAVCVKNDTIISIFRDSSWQVGNYTCSVFGNIIDCYNSSDNKKFAAIQGSCSFYNEWNNNEYVHAKELYGNNNYSKVSGCFKTSNTSTPLTKDYLQSVISRTTDNTNFCACTGSYLSFVDNISNSANGSKYKGKIDEDVFRQCNELTSSEVVLDGTFIRIGSCLVGWDASNPSLLD